MGESTSISWCDHTFNPWWGCTRVSPGCEHCYAETFDKRTGGSHWGPTQERRRFAAKHWAEPVQWHAKALADGVRRRVFCASMADVLDDQAPEADRERLWTLVSQTPQLDWLLLTKRPQNWRKYCPAFVLNAAHVWKGCTAEDMEWFDKRWQHMRDLPGIRFVSYEPALGFLRLGRPNLPDWIICGGESGPGHRRMDPLWAMNLLNDCRYYGVPFFMKQMSAATPAKGKALIPEHLQIQEFPA